jgi:hypothetical protein
MASEKSLSHQLVEYLESFGYMVQRLESGGTGRGIPDMVVVAGEKTYFFELKARTFTYVKGLSFFVPWRVGQQAWAQRYYRSSKFTNCVFTIMKSSNNIIVIPMTKYYEDNIVLGTDDVFVYKSLKEFIL